MTSDDIYPSRFLKAADLEKPFVGAIDRVVMESVGRAKETKPVLYIDGLDKPMTLNKTNFSKIATITGEIDSDMWYGKAIEIYATTCEFGGDTVDCLRIRAPQKKKKARKPASESWDSDAPPLDSEAI